MDLITVSNYLQMPSHQTIGFYLIKMMYTKFETQLAKAMINDAIEEQNEAFTSLMQIHGYQELCYTNIINALKVEQDEPTKWSETLWPLYDHVQGRISMYIEEVPYQLASKDDALKLAEDLYQVIMVNFYGDLEEDDEMKAISLVALKELIDDVRSAAELDATLAEYGE